MSSADPPPRRRPDPDDPAVRYVVESEGRTLEDAIQINFVGSQGGEFRRRAQEVLGRRFGEMRIDGSDRLLVTVIDLTDDDIAALEAIGRDCDVEGWVAVRAADPAGIEAWERLRHDLLELQRTRPEALSTYPTPVPGYRQPPFEIQLNPTALDVAVGLHERFGEVVELRVGVLPYPPREESPPVGQGPAYSALVDPAEVRVELDGPLRLPSGATTTHGLLVTNLGTTALTMNTNGNVTAAVADPTSGERVGGFSGAQTMPLVTFTAGPGETVRVPILVGTASEVPRLGYAVPAGEWAVYAVLELEDGRALRTALLPIVVTAPA